eukprot:198370-Pelagomonas_calceolata.AAC.5
MEGWPAGVLWVHFWEQHEITQTKTINVLCIMKAHSECAVVGSVGHAEVLFVLFVYGSCD